MDVTATLGIVVVNGQAIAAHDQYDRAADKTVAKMSGVEAAMKKLTAAFSIYAAIRVAEATIRTADAYTQLQSRLRLVTDSAEQLNRVQAALFAQAQESRTGFSETAELYARIARNADSLGLSESKLLTVTETINKAMAISGTSAESASAALVQLGQAFASNRLGGDELRSVLEQAPRLAQAIADGMGVSIGKLRELGQQGKLTGKAVADALVSQASAVQSEFGKVPTTVAGAMQQVKNALLQYIGSASTANGTSRTLAAGLTELSKHVDDLATAGEALAVVFGARLFGNASTSIAALTAATAKGRAETIAYAEDTARTAQAKVAESAAEVEAANARRATNAVTLQAIEAERALRVVSLSTANARLATASAAVANPAGSGFTPTEALAAQAVATRNVSVATAELSKLGVAQAGVNRNIAVTAQLVATAEVEQAVAASAAATAQAALAKASSFSALAMGGLATAGRSLLALVGGPLGVGILAIAANYAILSRSIDEAKRKQQELQDEFAKGLKGLALPQLDAQLHAVSLALEETRTKLAALGAAPVGGGARAAGDVNPADATRAQLTKELTTLTGQYTATLAERKAVEQAVNGTVTTGNTLAADQAKALRELADANASRVREAQQALVLAGLDDKQAAQLTITYHALNESIKATATAREAAKKGDAFDLPGTLAAIEAERKLATAALKTTQQLAERAKVQKEADDLVAAGIHAAVSEIDDHLTAALKKADDEAKELRDTLFHFKTDGLFDIPISKTETLTDRFHSLVDVVHAFTDAMVHSGQSTQVALAAALNGITALLPAVQQLREAQEEARRLQAAGASPQVVAGATSTASANLGGAAIGLVAGALTAWANSTHAAADEARRVAEALVQLRVAAQRTLDAFSQRAFGSSRDNALADVDAQFKAVLRGLNAAGGNDPFTGRTAHNVIPTREDYEEAYKAYEKLRGDVIRAAELQLHYAGLDLDARLAAAQGRDDESRAILQQKANEQELEEARLAGADATRLAYIAEVQQAEADKRRRDEEKRQAEELAAALEKAADAMQALRNQVSGLLARVLTATGNTRGAEDVTRAASNAQELYDAIKAGMNPMMIAFIQFTQAVEASAVQMQRAIEDGTAAINKQREADLAEAQNMRDFENARSERELARLDTLINVETKRAQAEQKAFDDEIDAVQARTKAAADAAQQQIDNARASLEAGKAQLSVLEKQVQTAQKVVDALDGFLNSSKLGANSPLSPQDQLAEAQRQFGALLASAQGGNSDAAAGLPSAASTLLEQARAFYGSGVKSNAIFEQVQAALAGVRDQFGKTLPTDVQSLEALKASLSAQEASLEQLQANKAAIEAAGQKEVAELQKAKQAAKDASDALLDTYRTQQEAEKTRHSEALAKIDEEIAAINKAADDQIAQLIKDEQLKHDVRVRALEFYDQFNKYRDDFATLVYLLTKQPLPPGTTIGNPTRNTLSGGANGAPKTPPADNPVASSIVTTGANTVSELKDLRAEVTELRAAVVTLTRVAAAASDRETQIATVIASNTGTLVTIDRAKANPTRALPAVR